MSIEEKLQVINVIQNAKHILNVMDNVHSITIEDGDDKHYTTLQEAMEDCMKVIDQIVDKKFDFYNFSLWKPNLDALLYSNVIQDNPSIKDFSLNDEIAHWDADRNNFTINDKKVDTYKTIVENYKIYPTFKFDSGIEIKTKEIVWEEN